MQKNVHRTGKKFNFLKLLFLHAHKRRNGIRERKKFFAVESTFDIPYSGWGSSIALHAIEKW